jgi:hypothetical protein
LLRLYLSIKIRAVLSEANDKMQVFLYFDMPSTTDNTQAAKPPTKKEENDHGQHRGAFSSFSFLSHRLQDEGARGNLWACHADWKEQFSREFPCCKTS